jgi:hypothetical protein
MENRDKQDGIRSWCQLVQQFDTYGFVDEFLDDAMKRSICLKKMKM